MLKIFFLSSCCIDERTTCSKAMISFWMVCVGGLNFDLLASPEGSLEFLLSLVEKKAFSLILQKNSMASIFNRVKSVRLLGTNLSPNSRTDSSSLFSSLLDRLTMDDGIMFCSTGALFSFPMVVV